MACLKQSRPLTSKQDFLNMEENAVSDNSAISKHDRYLITLEKHKKYLKGLNTKSKADEEREKRERAFSPYVNGANAIHSNTSPRKKYERQQPPSPRVTTVRKQQNEEIKAQEITPRPKSALQLPSHTQSSRQRKFWGQGSVQIKQTNGNILRAARENIDHSYADDFEDYESSDSEEDEAHVSSTMDSDDEEENIPEELATRKCWKDTPRIRTTDIVCHSLTAETVDSLNLDKIPVLGKEHKSHHL